MAPFSTTLGYILFLLVGLASQTVAQETNEFFTLTLVNQLPEPVIIHWESLDGKRVPQHDDVVPGKGGEISIKTVPHHIFSYDYGGHRHFVNSPTYEQVAMEPNRNPVIILTAGKTEILIDCMVTSHGRKKANLPLRMRVIPWWSPRGATRFLDLVRAGYYNEVALYRSVPNFLTQFGISSNVELRQKYQGQRIFDDPLPRQINFSRVMFQPGFMSFAGSGDNSRTTEVFIVQPGATQRQLNHFGTNLWETPFGLVDFVEETPVADFYSYGDIQPFGDGPDPAKIYENDGYDYLKQNFPKMDIIQQCNVIEISAEDVGGGDL